MSATCEVSLGDYDGDAATVYNEFECLARKQHKCCECGDAIVRGQRHAVVTGLWDGSWSTYRFCLPCDEASREFFDGGRTFGVLWEGMEQEWDQGAYLQACLNRLATATAKAHMRRQWLRWKGLE